MKKLKTVHFLVLIALLPMMLAAQPEAVEVDQQLAGVIAGQIYDAETKEPLGAVNVFIDSLFIGAATSPDGKFILRYVQPGAYRLVASRLGYETAEENLVVAPGKLVAHQIALRPTEINGEAVTITATRREQTAQMAPASVVILNARDLRERSVVTFDQALEMVPGISVYRASGLSVQSLSIRGSSDVAGGGVGNRVLLMIDGRPALTSDSGGALWSLVPTNFIDHIEVVKGAFSSLYGSTAMGGVINVITRRPAYRSLTSLDIGYGFFDKPAPAWRYTNRTPQQNQIELSHSGNRGRASYLLNFSRKQSDGHAENTAYEFYNVYGKVLYDLRQNRNLELSFGVGMAENDYPHTWLIDQTLDFPVQPFRVTPGYRDDRQTKRTYSVDWHYWAVPSSRLKYSSRFYFYRNHARSLFNENDPLQLIPDNQPFGLKTIVEADKIGNLTQFDYYLSRRHYLIAGTDLQVDHVDSSPDTVMYGNRQVNNAAVYLQDEIELAAKLTATIGLRYDWNHLVGGVTQRQISPKLAFVFRPQNELALRLLLGQAFRSPSIAERFFQRELGGSTLFKPNPNLKPERVDFSLETGLRWRWRDLAEIDFAYFRYHYRDMLYWIEISAEEGVLYTLFQVRNLKRALMQGLEAELRLHWKNRLHTSFSYTYLDAEDQSPNQKEDFLAYRVRHSFFVAADANVKRLTLSLHGQYKSKLEEVFLYPRDIPQAFVVANAKATLRLSERYQLSLAANNIFNRQYEELERYRMPSRNWIFGTRLQF
jgi:outer membrane receptor for ferrienterochelin and colicin